MRTTIDLSLGYKFGRFKPISRILDLSPVYHSFNGSPITMPVIAGRFQKVKRYMGRPLNEADNQIREARQWSCDLLNRILRKPAGSPEAGRNHIDRTVNQPTPQIVVTFAKAVTSVSLSNLLIWYFYYDVVELPLSPARWYKPIPAMEMRGWIALGEYIRCNPNFNPDLADFYSLCVQLGLSDSMVEDCLAHLSDFNKMGYTQLAMIIRGGRYKCIREAEILDMVVRRFRDTRTLLRSLKPLPNTPFAMWRERIFDRLEDFLDVTIYQRLSLIRGGVVVQVNRPEDEVRHLGYLFAAMQEPRRVPLIYYGLCPDPSLDVSRSTSSDSRRLIFAAAVEDQCNVERAFSVGGLKAENRRLKAKIAEQEERINNLEAANQKISRRISSTPRAYPFAVDRQARQRSEECHVSFDDGGSIMNRPRGVVPGRAIPRKPVASNAFGITTADLSGQPNRPLSMNDADVREWLGSQFGNRPLPALPLAVPSSSAEARRRHTYFSYDSAVGNRQSSTIRHVLSPSDKAYSTNDRRQVDHPPTPVSTPLRELGVRPRPQKSAEARDDTQYYSTSSAVPDPLNIVKSASVKLNQADTNAGARDDTNGGKRTSSRRKSLGAEKRLSMKRGPQEERLTLSRNF